MAKTKRKRQKQSPNPKDAKSCNASSISFTNEELQHIIAKAIVEAKMIEQDCARFENNNFQNEHRQLLSSNAEAVKQGFLFSLSNFFKNLWKLITFPLINKRKITGDNATIVLSKMCIEVFLQVAKIISAIACVTLFIVAVSILFAKSSFSWVSGSLCFILSFNCYLLFGMFRAASIEVGYINDKSFLFGLFGAISSFVSTTIAIISLVIGG